jgi:hypothetical protein
MKSIARKKGKDKGKIEVKRIKREKIQAKKGE